MRRLFHVLLIAGTIAAQDAPAPPAGEPMRHEVRLAGGTRLVGSLAPPELRVETEFGPLTVPAGEVLAVRFGRRSDAGRRAQVLADIERLGAEDAADREAARERLAAGGAFAAGEMDDAARQHLDPEVRRACGKILDGLELDAKEYMPLDDVVETRRFSIAGRIQEEEFLVQVPELGALRVRRSDIVRIGIHRDVEARTFRVTGDNLITGTWFDTKIDPPAGARVRIYAQGSITFPQWGGNSFDPEGIPNFGMVHGLPVGCLAGRRGEGPIFRVGRSYTGYPDGEGTLRLAVIAQFTGQPHTGEYRVRVEVE